MNSPNTTPVIRDRARFVSATEIAQIYGVTPRYVLQLAAQERIPCLRMGKRCVRFDPVKVAAAIEQDGNRA